MGIVLFYIDADPVICKTLLLLFFIKLYSIYTLYMCLTLFFFTVRMRCSDEDEINRIKKNEAG